jgi:hypothetical protein
MMARGADRMISLTCTNCQTVLTIDDAFAGGVCRCQHCGTIQTVPSHLKRKRAAAPGGPGASGEAASPASGRTLYQKRPRQTPGSGTGLEDLAEAVTGSGIGSGGLTSSRFGPGGAVATKTTVVPHRQWLPIAAGAAIALVAAAALVIWWLTARPAPPAPTAPQTPAAPSGTPEVVSAGPSFCGVTLDGPVIVYVLDRGNATRDVFDLLKEATYKSIQSLGAERKFQVLFWNNGSDEGYPTGLPVYARGDNLSACRRAMEDTTAFGQSDVTPAMTKAIANKASVIVLATGKGLDLDSSFVEHVMEIRKNSPAKVHTFALGESESPVLKELAQKTGGEYKTVSAALLRSYAD